LETEFFCEVFRVRDFHNIWPSCFVGTAAPDDRIDLVLRLQQRPYACNHSDTHAENRQRQTCLQLKLVTWSKYRLRRGTVNAKTVVTTTDARQALRPFSVQPSQPTFRYEARGPLATHFFFCAAL
jgi:hypothetical protein